MGVWIRLTGYLRPRRGQLVSAALVSALAVGFELAKPWPLKVVIDQVLLGKPWAVLPAWMERGETLLWLAIAATIGFAALGGVSAYFRDLWLADAGQRAVNAVRRDALEAVLRQSLAWHERHRAGDLLVRLCADAQSLRLLLVEGIFSLGREGLLVAGILAVMAWVDWRLTLAAVIVLPAVGALSALFSIKLRAAARKQRKKEGLLATSAHETLAAVPVIQAYGLEANSLDAFSAQSRKSARANREATRLEGRLGAATDIALALGTAFVLWLGVLRVRAGALSPGELIVLLAYARSFYRPIRKGLGRSAAMIKAAAAGERVLDLLHAVPDLPEPAQPRPLPIAAGAVEFRDVRFGHLGKRDILHGVTFSLQPGEQVALLGGNGAGKSTLGTLLARLRDPVSGSVTLDGIDLRELARDTIRRHVAVVFQQSVLFDGTLRENLLLARPDADPATLASTATRTGVMDLAGRLPLGLETPVGPGGAQLSGGERQRVALARALLRDASVYVFDEPSTGLDAASATLLRDKILPSLRGRTVLLITHDPRLIDVVDRVIRLEHGRITSDERPHNFVVLDGTGGHA